MIVLNDTLGAFGGSHTLFLRMCEWYTKQQINVSFFCNNRDNEEIASHLETMGVSIYVINTGNMQETYKLLKSIDDGDLRVINFWWNMYLDIEAVKFKYKLSIENMIYLIHPKCLVKGDSYHKKSLLLNHIKNRYKRILSKMCANSAIVSMDEINIGETEDYYKVKLNPVPKIIRLPMKIESVEKEKVLKEGFESRTIMTSCRADFPYKGYVVGLVDDFVKIKKKYPDVKLLIICDGDDIDILHKKISDLPEKYKETIQVFNWMSYEQLKEKMKECMLYVGMGSSVLDSSLCYKPSIVIKFYTMECLGKSFTADNPYDLSAGEDVKTSAAELLDEALKMEFEEYKKLSERTYNAISSLYGVENVMEQFMQHKTNDGHSILNHRDYRLIAMNNFVNAVRFRKKDEKSSFKNLSTSKDK